MQPQESAMQGASAGPSTSVPWRLVLIDGIFAIVLGIEELIIGSTGLVLAFRVR